jgi:hypothetical protein
MLLQVAARNIRQLADIELHVQMHVQNGGQLAGWGYPPELPPDRGLAGEGELDAAAQVARP